MRDRDVRLRPESAELRVDEREVLGKNWSAELLLNLFPSAGITSRDQQCSNFREPGIGGLTFTQYSAF
jgi:hypothetical protein